MMKVISTFVHNFMIAMTSSAKKKRINALRFLWEEATKTLKNPAKRLYFFSIIVFMNAFVILFPCFCENLVGVKYHGDTTIGMGGTGAVLIMTSALGLILGDHKKVIDSEYPPKSYSQEMEGTIKMYGVTSLLAAFVLFAILVVTSCAWLDWIISCLLLLLGFFLWSASSRLIPTFLNSGNAISEQEQALGAPLERKMPDGIRI